MKLIKCILSSSVPVNPTYFCHIFSMEARIFMKFETEVHKIVPDHQSNFHKDPCRDARARGVNTRTRDEIVHQILTSLPL